MLKVRGGPFYKVRLLLGQAGNLCAFQPLPLIYHHSSWALEFSRRKWMVKGMPSQVSSGTNLNFSSLLHTNGDIKPQRYFWILLCQPHLCQARPKSRGELGQPLNECCRFLKCNPFVFTSGNVKVKVCIWKAAQSYFFHQLPSWKCSTHPLSSFRATNLGLGNQQTNGFGWLRCWISRILQSEHWKVGMVMKSTGLWGWVKTEPYSWKIGGQGWRV